MIRPTLLSITFQLVDLFINYRPVSFNTIFRSPNIIKVVFCNKLTLLFSAGRVRVVVSAWGLEGTPPPQGAVTAPPPVTISLASHSRLITDTQLTHTDTERRLTDLAARNHATVLLPAARSSTRDSRATTGVQLTKALS